MLNYPIKKRNSKSNKNFSNKGMLFEEEINMSNQYYFENELAYIYKRPTPINVVNVKDNIITKAYFKEKSTTDYVGIYKGYYIDFEAKECNSNKFILSNLKEHQYNHLINISKNGGIGFLFILFNKINKAYIIDIKKLKDYNKNSIDLNYINKIGYEVKRSIYPSYKYLKVVDSLIKENS